MEAWLAALAAGIVIGGALGLIDDQKAVAKVVVLIAVGTPVSVSVIVVAFLMNPPDVCEGYFPKTCRELTTDETILGFLPWLAFALTAWVTWGFVNNWRQSRKQTPGAG